MIGDLKRITKSSFFRNVMVVASGTAGAQAISMAFSPLITRLYGPENYGIMGTFMAGLTMLAPLAALGYPTAIVLPKDGARAVGLIKLSLWIALITSTILLIALFVAGEQIGRSMNISVLGSYIYLLPLAMFFSACLAISTQYVIREKLFAIRAKAAVAQALLVGAFKVGAGIISPTAIVLVALSGLASLVHTLFILLGLKRAGVRLPSLGPEPRLMEVADQYRDFPVYRAPQNFINAVSQGLPVLLLASLSGAAAAGFYSLARTVLILPVNLVANSVGEVFYPHVTEAFHQHKKQAPLIIKATMVLGFISAAPFAIVFLIGPWLFGWVFGSDWVLAGEYASWLSLMMFFNFINKPSVAAIPVLGLQRGLLIYEVFSTGAKLLALYLGFVVFDDALLAIVIFSLSGAGAYVVLIIWTVVCAWNSDRKRASPLV